MRLRSFDMQRRIELRWLNLTRPDRARLQFREITQSRYGFPRYGEWQDVPVVDQE